MWLEFSAQLPPCLKPEMSGNSLDVRLCRESSLRPCHRCVVSDDRIFHACFCLLQQPQRSDRSLRRSPRETPLLRVPSLADAPAEAIDGRTLRFLLKKLALMRRKVDEMEQAKEDDEEWHVQLARGGPSIAPSSSHPVRRKRKKRRKKLPRSSSLRGSRLPRAYAKISVSINAFSSCSSGACGKQVLQAFAAALEATPVSVCVAAEFWNDFTGGVLSDRHPEEQFFQDFKMPVDFVPSPVFQYVPRFSGGVNSGVSEVVSAVKNQDLCGSCSPFCYPSGGIAAGADFGWTPRGSHRSVDLMNHFTCGTVRSTHFSWCVFAGVKMVVSAVNHQRHKKSCSVFSVQPVGLQLVLPSVNSA